MDISDTIEPKSDQLDAVDLLAGPRTFTITAVNKPGGEQPVDITLAEFPRVWRPGLSMRRVLVYCWGRDASQYVGRRVTLYCDPSVQFGGEKVGGTRISHLSHIEKSRTVPLLEKRGKSGMFRVQPLVEDASPPRSQKAEAPLAERIAGAVQAFAGIGVTEQQLAERIGYFPTSWTAEHVADLGTLFRQLEKGEVTKAEAFPDPAPDDDYVPPPAPPGSQGRAEGIEPDPGEYDPTLDPNFGREA